MKEKKSRRRMSATPDSCQHDLCAVGGQRYRLPIDPNLATYNTRVHGLPNPRQRDGQSAHLIAARDARNTAVNNTAVLQWLY